MKRKTGKKKFNTAECRWKADFGTDECVVRGNAVFPPSFGQKVLASKSAVILRPNSYLSEDWQEGICRLASAAPEMLALLKRMANLSQLTCLWDMFADRPLKESIKAVIAKAEGEAEDGKC